VRGRQSVWMRRRVTHRVRVRIVGKGRHHTTATTLHSLLACHPRQYKQVQAKHNNHEFDSRRYTQQQQLMAWVWVAEFAAATTAALLCSAQLSWRSLASVQPARRERA
jgi:hypothetical protein